MDVNISLLHAELKRFRLESTSKRDGKEATAHWRLNAEQPSETQAGSKITQQNI